MTPRGNELEIISIVKGPVLPLTREMVWCGGGWGEVEGIFVDLAGIPNISLAKVGGFLPPKSMK